MIITRQDSFSFRLQTGETVINFEQRSSPSAGLAGFLELKVGKKRLFIETPGEYEMEGIAIEGTPSFYTIRWDDMVIGLGNLAQKTNAAYYDILLLLVTKPSETAKALTPLCGDARILIPFGEEKAVASFLKELDESAEEMEKVTLKKKDIPPEGDRKIILLKPLKK